MKFNLVVFGCDNSGKTTLCNDICNYFNSIGDITRTKVTSSVVHSLGAVNKFKQIKFMSDMLVESDKRELEIQIFDRFPIIEEFICGNILRGLDQFEMDHYLKSVLLGKITFFIYCKPPYEKVENWGTREQMEGVKENARDMYKAYGMVPKKFDIAQRTIEYDYTKDCPMELAHKIVTFLLFLNENKIRH